VVKYHERMFAAREAAGVADTALAAVIRKALPDDDSGVAEANTGAADAKPAETDETTPVDS
jgi:hypothetical protein